MNLKKSLLSTSRHNKKLLALTCDFASLVVAMLLALMISNVDLRLITSTQLFSLSWTPFLCLVTFWYFGVYSSVVRYIDLSVIFILAKATFLVTVLSIISKVLYLLIMKNFFEISSDSLISAEGWLIGLISFSFLITASRLTANYFLRDRKSEKRVIIYGAGSAGIQLASALSVSKEMQPVAFIDQNPSLHGNFIRGIKVLHPKKLERLALRGSVDEVLIAIPSASKSTLRSLLKEIENYSLKVRILPGLAELAQGKILVSELKEVDISDLLGRYEVEANQALIDRNIQNKVVLITGAGGSIGSEISRQAVRNKAKKVILVDSNEFALYSIKNEIESFMTDTELYAVLTNVNNDKRMKEVLDTFEVDTIYHTAAYKHVPLVEENPFEAVINNILGTKICVDLAIQAGVETFVLISTDKAVRPTNIMGATKRFAELILQSVSKDTKTRMIMVRFGNVIGSSGSAIPLFQKQIKEGGPVTVTHPEVIRYFMSIPEAAELVIQAGAMGVGGDVFVLDMGEPVKIYDLAKRLINLSGMEVRDDKNPEGEIEIVFTGLRHGEKLFEELLIGDNVSTTEHKQILRAEEDSLSVEELDQYIDLLKQAEISRDVAQLKEIFKQVVMGFTPEAEVLDIVHQQSQEK